ncbi:MAG: acyltransferase family protein, partial [Candidatus Binatia bacterium]
AAVVLFFVLSGFVLTRSLDRCQGHAGGKFAGYACRRALRILPVAIVTALPYALIAPEAAARIVGAMFLFDYSLNGPIWSLQVEIVGSLFVFALSACGLVRLWLATAAATWLACSQSSHFFLFMPAFALGALVSRSEAAFWRSPRLLAAAVASLLLVRPLFGVSLVSIAGETVGAAAIVGCVGRQEFGWLRRRPIQLLGSVSYPFYLLHGACLYVAIWTARFFGVIDHWPQITLVWLYAAISLPIAIPAAWAVHVAVELPGIAAGRRIAANVQAFVTRSSTGLRRGRMSELAG